MLSVYSPKSNLPRLKEYSVTHPPSYCESLTKLEFEDVIYKSCLDQVEFKTTAIETGYLDVSHVSFIQDYLSNGARIGCHGKRRLPQYDPNRGVEAFSS